MPKYKKGQLVCVDFYRESDAVLCIMEITQPADYTGMPKAIMRYPNPRKFDYGKGAWSLDPDSIKGPIDLILCIQNKI